MVLLENLIWGLWFRVWDLGFARARILDIILVESQYRMFNTDLNQDPEHSLFHFQPPIVKPFRSD